LKILTHAYECSSLVHGAGERWKAGGVLRL